MAHSRLQRPPLSQIRGETVSEFARGRSRLGNASPNRGKRCPALGRTFPNAGKSRPTLGKFLPNVEKILPSVRRILSNVQKSLSGVGKILLSVQKILSSLGKAFPAHGKLSPAVFPPKVSARHALHTGLKRSSPSGFPFTDSTLAAKRPHRPEFLFPGSPAGCAPTVRRGRTLPDLRRPVRKL